MTSRNSNFEFLRILSMVLIVAGHLFQHVHSDACLTWFGGAASSFLRIAVNVFLMLGTWFMVDTSFSPRRLIQLYEPLFFYSFFPTVLAVFVLPGLSLYDIARGLLPASGYLFWFASAYLALMLFSPYLQMYFRLSREAQRYGLILMFFVLSVYCTISGAPIGVINDVSWFGFVYLAVGYVKHQTKWIRPGRGMCFLSFGTMLYGVMATLKWLSVPGVDRLLMDVKSIPNFLIAGLLFLGFASLPSRQSVIINRLAKFTFAVYLIHCMPFFSGRVMDFVVSRMSLDSTIEVIACSSLIFLLCIGVEYVRQTFYVSALMRLNVLARLQRCVEGAYRKSGFALG